MQISLQSCFVINYHNNLGRVKARKDNQIPLTFFTFRETAIFSAINSGSKEAVEYVLSLNPSLTVCSKKAW